MVSFCDHRVLCYGRFCDPLHGHICDFTMDCKLEQRANIKFCVKLGKSATETFDTIRYVYGNEAVSRVTCFEWHARFKSGRTSLDDDKRYGRPSTNTHTPLPPPRPPTKMETIRRLVYEGRQRFLNDIAAIVYVSY